jgi:predicted ArsR family transcriptional regulator
MATTKINLTSHQRCVLRAAARSANLNAWPLPQRLGLSKGSATIVVKGLLKKGLIAERAALGHDAIWREAEDGRPMTLVITKAGLAAVGMLPGTDPEGKQAADETAPMAHDEAQRGPTAAVSDQERLMPKAGTKLATLIALLERDEGATIEEMAETLDWQQHTVRGVMSGALVKRFRLVIVSEKVEGRGRVYGIERTTVAGADEVDTAGE